MYSVYCMFWSSGFGVHGKELREHSSKYLLLCYTGKKSHIGLDVYEDLKMMTKLSFLGPTYCFLVTNWNPVLQDTVYLHKWLRKKTNLISPSLSYTLLTNNTVSVLPKALRSCWHYVLIGAPWPYLSAWFIYFAINARIRQT